MSNGGSHTVNTSALRNQVDNRARRLQYGEGVEALSVVATVPTLTPAQRNSNFEDWIKMCTDNKVNSTNTWNFALIDYFHEMSFIREGDSINFQKASCTLDGCVKIYTSRVDSVAAETGKLLSGLADSTNGDGDEDTRNGERKVRKKTARSEATLLKDFSQLALKKFDLDFAVDPLFKKTSADFDEGGARGLLLNHLGTDQDCKIIFDASDAAVECDLDGEKDGSFAEAATANIEEANNGNSEKDEEQNNEHVTADKNDTEENDAEKDETVDLMDGVENGTETANKDVNMEDVEEETIEKNNNQEEDGTLVKGDRVEVSRFISKLPDSKQLFDWHLAPPLTGFNFFTENDSAIPNLENTEEDEPAGTRAAELTEQFQFDDFDMDFGNDDIDTFDNDDNVEDMGGSRTPEIDTTEKVHAEQDFITAMLNSESKDLFTYFDNTLDKNWAGPEHWKLRKPVVDQSKQTEETDKPKKKVAKVDPHIPFDDSENDEDEDELFATATRKLTLTKDALSKMTKPLLPDDIHFSSKQLLQYFLKPMFPTDGKRKNINNTALTAGPNAPEENGGENPDIDFWANQGQDMDMDMDADYGDDVDFDSNIPTDTFDNDQTQLTAFEDTSFYQDNLDTPEDSILYGDALITNHTLKKTKPLYVNYARQAKRVDVKKLKDNLWKVLTSNQAEEKIQGVLKFTDIVQNLKKMYSVNSMKDISIPFCFICLLHLANEKDLSIGGMKGQDEEDDDYVLGDDNDWMNNETVLNQVTVTQNE